MRVTEKAQHTPGPWHISDHISKGLILSSPGRSVARVMRDDQDPETTEANARLIAAAPALLEALRAALIPLIRLGDFIGNEDEGGASGLGPFNRCAIIGQVRDAIAQAEGTP